MSGNTRGQQITLALASKEDLRAACPFFIFANRVFARIALDVGKPLASHRRKRAEPAYKKDSFTRSIAGCERFFILTQSFDRPPR
jgi:hypothetical protein